MSDLKHTPGPWHAEDSVGFVTIRTAGGAKVASVGYGETDMADAQLLAAAPDLLEALNALVAMNNCWYDRGTADYIAAMERARAALEKATGQPVRPS